MNYFIKHMKWGQVIIEMKPIDIHFKDCRLFPGGVEEWDWKKTGTKHFPGIQYADVADKINNVDWLILSRGMEDKLNISNELLSKLASEHSNVKIIICNSKNVMNIYNKLVTTENNKILCLIHSTC